MVLIKECLQNRCLSQKYVLYFFFTTRGHWFCVWLEPVTELRYNPLTCTFQKSVEGDLNPFRCSLRKGCTPCKWGKHTQRLISPAMKWANVLKWLTKRTVVNWELRKKHPRVLRNYLEFKRRGYAKQKRSETIWLPRLFLLPEVWQVHPGRGFLEPRAQPETRPLAEQSEGTPVSELLPSTSHERCTTWLHTIYVMERVCAMRIFKGWDCGASGALTESFLLFTGQAVTKGCRRVRSVPRPLGPQAPARGLRDAGHRADPVVHTCTVLAAFFCSTQSTACCHNRNTNFYTFLVCFQFVFSFFILFLSV